MKKIINGKVYNTETAEEILEMSNGLPFDDMKHYFSSIYMTKKGALFLYESGGAMSKMGRVYGNAMTGGSVDITILDEDEADSLAADWAANNQISADKYQEYCHKRGIELIDA